MIFKGKIFGMSYAKALVDSTGDFAMSSDLTSVLEGIYITKHAEVRMNKRGITRQMIELVLMFGRKIYARGDVLYVMQERVVQRLHDKEEDLDQIEGIQVLT